MIKKINLIILTIPLIIFSACDSSTAKDDLQESVIEIDFKTTKTINNAAAYVASQCYTKTKDENGNIHNPCFSCHINADEPNYINDWKLQESYAVSDYTKTNRFTNLFKDRTNLVQMISDDEILEYIREDNYKQDGELILAQKLKNLPNEWDVNDDGKWNGYMPDCYFDFDNEGFDKDLNSTYTGWRAFGYYPFLGTFWPTNGSTDDVLIRLPKEFRQNSSGEYNHSIYKLNLAIVESLIKGIDIVIDTTDENSVGIDLNQNGFLDVASIIKYNWIKPSYDISTQKLYNFSMSYVGKAKDMLLSNEHQIAPKLYPKGTEFLHSVRYIDIDNETVKMAPRMKELRYAIKTNYNSYSQIQNTIMAEIKERDDFPDRLRNILGNTEDGLQTGLGWIYQGFIEDSSGNLRPQNYEETLYCIGCHSGIGAITDSTFVFQRKFDNTAFQKSWYHWMQDANGLKNIKEPKTKDDRYEYSLYLELNHAGDEFRANSEVMDRFFENNTTLKEDEISKLHNDISTLLYPSTTRALDLNKAYKIIVDEQSFIYGRDAHIKPVQNVHRSVIIGESTNIIGFKY